MRKHHGFADQARKYQAFRKPNNRSRGRRLKIVLNQIWVARSAAVTRPAIIADGWIVRTEGSYTFKFLLICFCICCLFRFPEDLFSGRKIFPFLSCEICRDEIVLCPSEVINTIRQILSYVDFPVRIGDFVDDLQCLELLEACESATNMGTHQGCSSSC